MMGIGWMRLIYCGIGLALSAPLARSTALRGGVWELSLLAGIPVAGAGRQRGRAQPGYPTSTPNPMPTTSGTLGLFTVETGEMLESGWSFSVYGNRFTRMPGSVVVSNYGIDGGMGISEMGQSLQPVFSRKWQRRLEIQRVEPDNASRRDAFRNFKTPFTASWGRANARHTWRTSRSCLETIPAPAT